MHPALQTGSHPRTSSCATISSRAHPTASHAWQGLSTLLSSGQRLLYRLTHISCAEVAADSSLSTHLSQTQHPAHLTALARLHEQSCHRPTCLHRLPLSLPHGIPPDTGHHHPPAFPRYVLTVQTILHPLAMWELRLELTRMDARRLQGRLATVTKCPRSLRPVRPYVRVHPSALISQALVATHSLRRP